jgi:hypothetical protein
MKKIELDRDEIVLLRQALRIAVEDGSIFGDLDAVQSRDLGRRIESLKNRLRALSR